MAISLDESGGNFSQNSTTVSAALTTSKTNDVIVVYAAAQVASGGAATVSSVSGGGLSWTKRKAATNGVYSAEIWWAVSAGTLSNVTITVTWNTTTSLSLLNLYGVNGGNTSVPWDANVSLPVVATGSNAAPSASGISTTTAQTMIWAFQTGSSVSTDGVTIGNTPAVIRNGNLIALGAYVIESTAQSGISAICADSVTTWILIIDALAQAHTPVVYSDSFADSVAASDSVANAMTMANTLSDSITSADSVSHGNVYVNAISDSVTAADSMTGRLIWDDTSPPGGTWTPAGAPTTVWTPASSPSTNWTKH